jgi:hypothetical protein
MSMPDHMPHDDASPSMESAAEAGALCDRLMEYTGEMIAVLERETGLLRSGKLNDIAAISARKAALSMTLTQDMSVFRREAEFIRGALPERIDAMREQHLALQKSLTANHDALAAMKAVSESMLQSVAAKVGEQTSGPSVYGKDASMNTARQAPGGNSISFDQTL